MRQPGQYADSGGNAYAAAQMQRMSGQRMEHKPNNYQGRADHVNSESEKSYGGLKGEGQWRWERDGSSHMFNEGQGADASRSYYQTQGQRSDQRLAPEKQGNDLRSQPREEGMDIGYEDGAAGQTFEGLEQRFYDDILKLTKEQNDAEDAENARHRERINAINTQYEEQLAALRARHTNRRDEFLRRESQARQQQYQQAAMEQQHASSAVGFSEPHGYSGGESLAHRAAYNTPHVDSYRDRPRFAGGNRDSRDPGFEPRGQYPGGRVYGSGSRYY
uniref:uncharacterized protein LOC122604361 n=1 Tax=Erigeron canadensis TaxID=72917 RepID=UPI001CB8FDF6|nr:uncharacterized protein LOC122604361 [Erigeron canadensis]XP_043633187.1 uncharacterized protein LOC122604361 [Erigeron canadensis]XP_043633188.1 uncharacterized protein LOC122604361 [Erigeron canadensis]